MYFLKIGPVAALVLSGVALFLLALAPLGWRIGLWQYGFGLYWMMACLGFIEFLSTFDRSNKPTRFRATTSPSFA